MNLELPSPFKKVLRLCYIKTKINLWSIVEKKEKHEKFRELFTDVFDQLYQDVEGCVIRWTVSCDAPKKAQMSSESMCSFNILKGRENLNGVRANLQAPPSPH